MLGPDEADGVLALWGDSWHQTPAAKQLRGVTGHDRLTVGYAYAVGWEWRITLTADRARQAALADGQRGPTVRLRYR